MAISASTKQSIKVIAYNEEHARLVAMTMAGIRMDQIIEVTNTKKPRPAVTCTTHDFPVKGTRKWKTEYHIFSYGQRIPLGLNKYLYTHMEFVEGGIETKIDAVKRAKELAVKKQLPMTVQIVQVLDSHEPTVSDVEPKTAMGSYLVTFAV